MTVATSSPPPLTQHPPATRRHDVVVVGGGTAGISAAARLLRRRPLLDVVVIEPSDRHAYQPLWTLVGGGVLAKEKTTRPQASIIPPLATWIRDRVIAFEPDRSTVVVAGGTRIEYAALIVAPGIRLAWEQVEGLPEAIADGSAVSIWDYDLVDHVWDAIRTFRGGTAVFTFPSTPIKCPGAAQKIAYLADETFRRAGVRDRTRIVFASAAPRIFGVDKYARALERVIARKDIETLFRHDLVAVEGAGRKAVFRNLDTGEDVTIPYDVLHVAPPQAAPHVVAHSSLAAPTGWAEVDRETLRHVRHPNVFSLGDASSLPTSKTGAAVRGQTPVVVENLLAHLDDREPTARYDGYTACPLVTGYGKLVLAEFDYDLAPRETFPFDQSKERRSMYQLKRHGLPLLYWQGMLRGRA